VEGAFLSSNVRKKTISMPVGIFGCMCRDTSAMRLRVVLRATAFLRTLLAITKAQRVYGRITRRVRKRTIDPAQ